MKFRDNVFNLCKIIKNIPQQEEISDMILSLNSHKNELSNPIISNLGYIAKQYRNQFYGYIFTYENKQLFADSFINFEMCNFSENEILLLRKSHATLNFFVESCLGDLILDKPYISKALNPYSKYKAISEITESSFFCIEDIKAVISSFKETRVYNKMLSLCKSREFELLKEDKTQILIDVISRKLFDSSLDVVTPDIKDYSFRAQQKKLMESQDVILNIVFSMVALREALFIACQLLFAAFVGENLIVLNNDNLVRIDGPNSNAVHIFRTAVTQGILHSPYTDIVGNVLISDYTDYPDHKVHEFGRIHSATFSINKEEGETTKFTFSILDDELNPISNLTRA